MRAERFAPRPAPLATLPGVVIPAYQPEPVLCELVERLLAEDYPFVIVVDDGSSAEHARVFETLAALPRVHVVRHFINLGKGDALKTGFNHALVHFPEVGGLVTVDADGQHLATDVLAVARALQTRPEALCLGVRDLRGDVPLRSRIGSFSSRWMLRLVAGGNVRDTQTGLRGIPYAFAADLLLLRTGRYEFEFEMLIRAGEQGVEIRQTPIATVYEDDNRGSHFDPLLDSLRVYFVFARFLVSSLLTAGLDVALFTAAYVASGSLLQAAVAGRLGAGTFNFLVNKRIVFKAHDAFAWELIKYVALVLTMLAVSYQLISNLHESHGVNVYVAKLGVEGFLFLVSFSVQRILVFTSSFSDRPPPAPATDWDAYYRRPGKLARLTRQITTKRLLACLRRYGRDGGSLERARIVELGGGNSCFYGAVRAHLAPAVYEVVDNNRTGLDLLRERESEGALRVHDRDVLTLDAWTPPADVCFSVGLIEHFDREGTRAAIRAHFGVVRPGGLVVLFFPTPTWLYRAARGVIEAIGMWEFPDERPLPIDEVVAEASRYGRVIDTSINWPIVLTQAIVVVEAGTGTDARSGRKSSSRAAVAPTAEA